MKDPWETEEPSGVRDPWETGDPQQPEEPGFMSAIKRGFQGSKVGAAAVNAANLSAEAATLPEGDPRKAEIVGGIQNNMADISRAGDEASRFPKSPEYEAFQKTEGFGDAAKAFIKDPWDITKEVIGESLGGQAKHLPLIAGATLAGGPVGLAASVGASSANLEYGSGIAEALLSAGVDIHDPQAVQAALNSPEFKLQKAASLKKAATVAVVDAATAGAAGMKLVSKPLGNVVAQSGLQATGGAGGEALGSIAAGQEISAPAVLAEAIGEAPGGVIDTTLLALRPKPQEHVAVLESVAADLAHEATTGHTVAQMEVKNEIAGENRKPKLAPLQSQIVTMAEAAGVDPSAALTIASIETGGRFDPDAKNPNSSAHGLFQIIDSTWEGLGGGDRSDPNTQITLGLQNLLETQIALEKNLGRVVAPEEIYLGHQLGPSLATVAIRAARVNPEGKFADTVRAMDPQNWREIVKNNGYEGKSNAEAIALWTDKYQLHSRKLGGDAQANAATKAGALSDLPPMTNSFEEIDKLSLEIDAELAMQEAAPVTDADRAAAAEEEAMGMPPEDADPYETLELDDGDSVPTITNTIVEPEAPSLPRELQAASPRYSDGKKNFDLRFDDDVDRAAYIIADPKKKSTRDAEYLQFVMQHTGMDEEEARAYGSEIKKRVKVLASETQGQEATTLTVATTQRSDSGVTGDEFSTREKYENPNDKIALTSLPIISGSNAGKTLKQVKLPEGVTAVGVNSRQTPMGYMLSMTEMLQNILGTYAPTARVAVSFQTSGKGDVSSYSLMPKLGKAAVGTRIPGLYRINLRNATNLGVTQDGSRNTTTQAKLVYAAVHEAGHVIADHQMTQGMSQQTLAKFRSQGREARDVFFDESDFAGLRFEQIEVLKEYNVRKQAVLNGEVTVAEFMDTWLSPWKLAHGWGKGQGKQSFLKKFFPTRANDALGDNALKFADMLHLESDILSPHEYLAEQTARYAYVNRLPEQNAGVMAFFQNVLSAMRAFFSKMKGAGNIKPGIAFAMWMDSLTATTRTYNEYFQNEAVPEPAPAPAPVAKPKAPRKAAAAEPAAVKPAAKPARKGKPKRTEVPVAPDPLVAAFFGKAAQLTPDLTDPDEALELTTPTYAPMSKLELQRFLETNPEMGELRSDDPDIYGNIMELIRKGRLDDARYVITSNLSDEVVSQIRWDTDNPEDMSWKDLHDKTLAVTPKRSGLNRWFGDGLKRLTDLKYQTLKMDQISFMFPDIAGLQYLLQMARDYKAYKAKLEVRGLEAADQWAKLGKEQRGLLEQAMREEHVRGEHFAEIQNVNGSFRFVPTAQLLEFASKKGLGELTVKAWMDAKNAHLHHMNSLQAVLRQRILQSYKGKPKTQKVKLSELHQMFESIRAKPFLPQTRFGDYALKVMEKGGLGEQAVHIEFFETAAMRNEAIKELSAKVGKGRRVVAANYETTSGILRTLPPQVLMTVANEMQLTELERKELKEIADIVTRNQHTRRYSSQLAGITGANKDLLRNFADFMWHNSNNIAKLRYNAEWRKGLRMIHGDLKDAEDTGDLVRHAELSQVLDFAKKYVAHWQSPADEWQKVRSFVVVKMLWGKISTALINVTALQNVWALAATQQGLVGGTAATGTALAKSLAEGFANSWQKVTRQPVEGSQVFNELERKALDAAYNEGLLDESYAAQLATYAQSGVLSRLGYQNEMRVRKAIWAGMLPQHLVEKTVRRTTFLQQFNHYTRSGMPFAAAYDRAKNDTYQLDGDNTLMNRPAFMRGKAALFTIFYGFVQNQLYLLSGTQEKARNLNKAIAEGRANMSREEARARFYKRNWVAGETTKMWLAYLFMGGVMGLPGADDLDKILELVAKHAFGERFSLKEYAYEMAANVAEEASALGVDIHPRSLVHGNMSQFSFFGLTPEVDLSASVGLGQALPGSRMLDGQTAGDAVLGLMGPLGGTVKQMYDAFADDATMSKKLGIAAPTSLMNFVRTFEQWDKGVRAPNGGRVTVDLETGEVRDLTTGEKIVSLMSFNPTVVSANKELHWMQRDQQKYWVTRRNTMLTQYYEAVMHGDREAQADADAKLAEYNAAVPPAMAITAKELRRSIKGKAKRAAWTEAGVPAQRRFYEMDEELESNFRPE